MGAKKKGVVLLSGGVDSATTLAIAKSQGFEIYALSLDYGQRHKVELEAARRIARQFGVADHAIVDIDLRLFGSSALTDDILRPDGARACGGPRPAATWRRASRWAAGARQRAWRGFVTGYPSRRAS